MRTRDRILQAILLGAALFGVAASLVECGGSSKFGGGALAITVQCDPALAPSIQLLAVSVSGAESDSVSVPVDPGFATSHEQKLDYRVQGTSGMVTVTVVGQGIGALPIAVGQADVTLQPGAAQVTVMLSAAPPPDLAAGSGDMGVGDMALPPAMTITPSHVPASSYVANAAPLSGVIGIDTDKLTITFGSGEVADGGGFVEGEGYDGGFTASATDGGANQAALDGIQLVVDSKSGAAVLSVGSWTVDKEVIINGSRPLVVVAASDIVVDQFIHAEAHGVTPGPGGSGPASGSGAGASAPSGNLIGGTGGGAGGLTAGGVGGCNFSGLCGNTVGGQKQAANLLTFGGGSGGGNGAIQTTVYPGAAGGGALQLSAGREVRVTIHGVIDAGGGGAGQTGGGGAGGTIFLEAPFITVAGMAAANGGGGGGPGCAGADAPLGSTSAPAAMCSGSLLTTGTGGVGGTTSPPTDGANGGGGGSAGFIWLRTTATGSASVTGSISPAPQMDNTL